MTHNNPLEGQCLKTAKIPVIVGHSQQNVHHSTSMCWVLLQAMEFVPVQAFLTPKFEEFVWTLDFLNSQSFKLPDNLNQK